MIQSLEKPLVFAAKNRFANLDKVQGLEGLAGDIVLKACTLELNSARRRFIKEIESSFAGYDVHTTANKKKIVRRTLERIKELGELSNAEAKGGKQTPVKPSAKSPAKSTVKLDDADSRPDDASEPSRVPIQYVKGVGPRMAQIFSKKGITTAEDALYYFPRRYEDRRRIKKIAEVSPGEAETIMGKVVVAGRVGARSRSLYKVLLSDDTGEIQLTWFQFNARYLNSFYKRGATVVVSGEVSCDRYSKVLQIVHPRPEDVEVVAEGEELTEDTLNFNRIVPIYPLTEGIGQRRLRKIMKAVVDTFAPAVEDSIPEQTKRAFSLTAVCDALYRAHFPLPDDRVIDLDDAAGVYGSTPHRTLAFWDFFLLELGLALMKQDTSELPGIAFTPTGELSDTLMSRLDFELTPAQTRTLGEIERDMRRACPMNRLLQGDVGSGKTVVALLSMLKAVECGYQAVMMAPTEILAEQHLGSVRRYLDGLGLRILLLKSGLTKKEKRSHYEAIRDGEAQIVLGTHALLEEGVEFKNLGFVIIDEQHRFGVMQRASLIGKGVCSDVLVMTATPIPRTLAMTAYGDLDVSVIDTMPPGRKPIATTVLYEDKGERDKAYDIIRKEVANGRQAYFVYPLIEESESPDHKELKHAKRMADELQNHAFPDYRVGLLHGRMKSNEKEEVMRRFVEREIDILVTTTVIEVGVDVPNATVMVVENAERFGLTQLHQLRGRIGRGGHKSRCILLCSANRTDVARLRLDIMKRTIDGFKIAEEDLSIRGPGDFMGTKQSGLPEFRFAKLLRDMRILAEAREEAFKIVKGDSGLEAHPMLRAEVIKRWGERLKLAVV